MLFLFTTGVAKPKQFVFFSLFPFLQTSVGQNVQLFEQLLAANK